MNYDVDERNAGASVVAAKLKRIAETGEHPGVFGGEDIEAAAQAILKLRTDLLKEERAHTRATETLDLANKQREGWLRKAFALADVIDDFLSALGGRAVPGHVRQAIAAMRVARGEIDLTAGGNHGV